MKGYKGLVPIVLIICLLLSVYMLVSTRTSVANEYNAHLERARDFASKGIIVDAVAEYTQAMAIENSIELNLELGEAYVKLGEIDSAIGWGQRMIELFPKSVQAYEFLLQRYRENNDFHRCYALYDTIKKRELSSDGIAKIMKDIKYVYYYGEAFEDVKTFSEGYCAVQSEGKWGLVTETGTRAVNFTFASVGTYFDGLAPVKTEAGEVFFVDNEGNKKKVIQIEGSVDQISSLVGDVYAAFNGTTWSFYDKTDKKLSEEYTNTSLLANTVAAVERNGKWEIVDASFKKVHAAEYVAVVQDDRGIIYRNGVIFADKGNGYKMVDAAGNEISDKVFADAKLFCDDTYAAVKTDKGWTYVKANGDFAFENLYFEDARSFVNGFAAVCKDGMWGFIDMEGNVVLDCQFAGAKDFNSSGCVFVKNEENWQLLRLYSMNYET